MRPRITPLALGLVGALGACDPKAGVYVRRSLAPAQAPDCVRAALASSPLVTTVALLDGTPRAGYLGYRVALRDSAAPAGTREARVELDADSAGPARLTVALIQRGEMTFTLGGERARHLAALANGVGQAGRAPRAPGAPRGRTGRVGGVG